MRGATQGIAIAAVALSAGVGCAPAQETKHPSNDQSFSAYEAAELEEEREEYISERVDRLAELEQEAARLEARLKHESAFVDASQRADWGQRLWDARRKIATLSAQMDRARTVSLLEWQQMRGGFATTIDVIQADVTKIGHDIADAFSPDEDENAPATPSNLCALAVPGATAVVETAYDRVELTVITTDDLALPSLRERAKNVSEARFYNHRKSGDSSEVVRVPIQTWFEPVAHGVKITFDPRDPNQLADLREAIATDARNLKEGSCSSGAPST